MAATTITATVQTMLREELPAGVPEILPDLDPVWKKIYVSSTGVERSFGSDPSSADFAVQHAVQVSGVAGAFQWKGPFRGASGAVQVAQSSSTADVLRSTFGYTALGTAGQNTFPGIHEATMPAIVRKKLTLVYGMGTIPFPIQILTANELSGILLDYVGRTIQLTARLVALMKCQAFYRTNNATVGDTGAFAQVNETTPTVLNTNAGATFGVDNGRIRQFYPGQLVEIWRPGAGTVPDTLVCPSTGLTNLLVVDRVDYINKDLTVYSLDGADIGADDILDNDYILPRASTTHTYSAGVTDATFGGPMGLEDWILEPDGAATTNFLGLILDYYPQLGSMVASSVGSLTEEVLNKYIGGFQEAYGNMVKIDTLISSGGVVREMLTQVDDLRLFEREGKAQNLQLGWEGFGYHYDGRKLDWIISDYVRPATLYGYKFGGRNIKRYTPPRVRTSGSNKQFDGEIQFMAPVGGSTSIFKHAHNTNGQTTEFVEAPFWTVEELAPEMPQGIMLSDVTESNP